MSKVVIAGGQNIGVSIFDYLLNETNHEVVFIIARTDDSGEDGAFPSLIAKAEAFGIDVISPVDVNCDQIYERLKSEKVDLVLSAMYNRIFKKPIIELMSERNGIINIHYAPLPRYSGFWPEMWAIWNNEKEFGVSYHYVDLGIDTGPIVQQKCFEISDSETRASLYEKCDKCAFEMFIADHSFIESKVNFKEQNNSLRTYYKKELPNGGVLDLDWSKEKIERYLRATTFYPYVNAKIAVGDTYCSIVAQDLKFGKPYYFEE